MGIFLLPTAWVSIHLSNETRWSRIMGNSLRDALTKAGVVNSAQAKVSAQQAKKQTRQELHTKRTGAPPVRNEAALAATKAQEEKLARDREMNREREAAIAAKAARAQARQMLRERMQNDESADLTFNFVEGGHIRHIYVTAPQRVDLEKGRLSVVALVDRHYLVPTEVADKVQTLIPEIFVYRPASEVTQVIPEDDPYAAYQIPDDLMW
ncbi:DUF2058 domain-containing protein [Gammaproteobacteria bacterium]